MRATGVKAISQDARCFILAILAATLTSAPVLAQTEDTVVPPSPPDAESYAECQQILDSPDFAALDEYVVEGRGSMIDDHDLGEALVGVDCSHSQIIAYMEREGFRFSTYEEWPELIGPAFNRINFRISFCAPATTFFNRLRGSTCEVSAVFYMNNTTVNSVGAVANK